MRRFSARLNSASPISAFFGRHGGLRRLALFGALFPVLFLFSEGGAGVSFEIPSGRPQENQAGSQAPKQQ